MVMCDAEKKEMAQLLHLFGCWDITDSQKKRLSELEPKCAEDRSEKDVQALFDGIQSDNPWKH